MNLKELANKSLEIENKLEEDFGIIDVSFEGKIELLVHKPKDFLDLTNGKYDIIEKEHNENFAADLIHENNDFKIICYLRHEELDEFKELTK